MAGTVAECGHRFWACSEYCLIVPVDGADPGCGEDVKVQLLRQPRVDLCTPTGTL